MSSRHLNGGSARPSSASRTGERRGNNNGHSNQNNYNESRSNKSKNAYSKDSEDADDAVTSDNLLIECKAAFIAVVKGSTLRPLNSRAELLLGKCCCWENHVLLPHSRLHITYAFVYYTAYWQ